MISTVTCVISLIRLEPHGKEEGSEGSTKSHGADSMWLCEMQDADELQEFHLTSGHRGG